MIHHLFRVDIGFDPERGYGAVLIDPKHGRQKGIKGNSIRQLLRRVSEEIANEEQKMRRFPLEHEREATKSIITPNDGDPLFQNGVRLNALPGSLKSVD